MKTPMSSNTKVTKDEKCESVDSTKYRGLIGSLLYLTASRPDIMFSVCLCARFQEAPKTSHIEAVKRIFRYIKDTTHLGLWYPKGTGIETVVYSDCEHARDYVDRKSTSGIFMFVRFCLTSWFSKKQTALAISTTEVEYISARKACQQALWMKQALIDYDAEHWVPNPDDGTYDVEGIRSRRPANISQADWEAQLAFWLDPKNAARSRSLAVLRDMQMENSATREYPSLIQTYFDTHTVDGVFLRDEERRLYEGMLRLQGLGPNTPTGVPYTDDEIMAIVRQGKQRGNLPDVGTVLVRQGRDVLEPRCTHTADVDELKRTNKQLKKQMDMIMKVVRSDDNMSQLLMQLQSQNDVGSCSESGGGGDDEDEDEDADDDEDS
ncbi:hypothetical protein Tco_0845412 [Tanacetum coccineum]